MSVSVRILLIFISIIMVITIFKDMVNKKISEKTGLMWLMCSFFIFLSGVFPELVMIFSKILGINYAPAAIFATTIIIIFLMLYKIHNYVSELMMKVQELAMQVSLLNQENEQLIQRIHDLEGEDKHE